MPLALFARSRIASNAALFGAPGPPFGEADTLLHRTRRDERGQDQCSDGFHGISHAHNNMAELRLRHSLEPPFTVSKLKGRPEGRRLTRTPRRELLSSILNENRED